MSENFQNKVRLKQFEIDGIKAAFAASFLPNDHLW